MIFIKPVVSISFITTFLVVAESRESAREKLPHNTGTTIEAEIHTVANDADSENNRLNFLKFARDYNIYHSLDDDHDHYHHYTRKSVKHKEKKHKKHKKKEKKHKKKDKHHSHYYYSHDHHSHDHNSHDHHSHDHHSKDEHYYYDSEDYYYDRAKYYYYSKSDSYEHSHTHSHDGPGPGTKAPNKTPTKPTTSPGTPTKSPTRNPTPTNPTNPTNPTDPSTRPPTKPPTVQSCPFSAFINEFHYQDTRGGPTQFIEVAHSLDVNIDRYRLFYYNGTTGKVYNEIFGLVSVLEVETEYNGMKVSMFPLFDTIFEIKEKNHGGFALFPPEGDDTLLDFVSYGGQFKATDGPIVGFASTDVGVTENNSTSVNDSIQRVGVGYKKSDFRRWGGPVGNSPGKINSNQVFDCGLPTSSQAQTLSTGGNVLAQSNALVQEDVPRVSPEKLVCKWLENTINEAIVFKLNICDRLFNL